MSTRRILGLAAVAALAVPLAAATPVSAAPPAPAVPVLEQHRQDGSAVTGLLDAMAAYDPTLFAVVGSEIR